jgi:oxygen-independent coproporphyrinogen III oxidase
MPTPIPFTIYIHVPFCKQACSYCDFYFVTREKLLPDYVDALVNEIRNRLPVFIQELDQAGAFSPVLESVYFGGGTPSRLPIADISRILKEIGVHVSLSTAKEITMEANPDDVSSAYMSDLRSLGVDRLSMGIQTFNPDLLTFMHRAHSSEEALKSLELVHNTGFPTFTVDLIYGNPGQSLEMLKTDLDTLLSFNPPHISAYALTIEQNTRLGKAASNGHIQAADDEHVAQHMELVETTLASAGIHRYEVSNFARKGHEAIHNSAYWRHTPYLGLGPGAHSLLFPAAKSPLTARRTSNPRDLKQYIDANGTPAPDENDTLDATALAEERILMGLRTREGITPDTLKSTYNYDLSSAQFDWILRMRTEGLMETDVPLRLTSKGYQTADAITLELISRQ